MATTTAPAVPTKKIVSDFRTHAEALAKKLINDLCTALEVTLAGDKAPATATVTQPTAAPKGGKKLSPTRPTTTTAATPAGTATAPPVAQLPGRAVSTDQLAAMGRPQLVQLATAMGLDPRGKHPPDIRTMILAGQGLLKTATQLSLPQAGATTSGECDITGDTCAVLHVLTEGKVSYNVSPAVKAAVEKGAQLADLISGEDEIGNY